MGDYSDFFGVRGKNKRTWVRVEYKSGRVEVHNFGTMRKAREVCADFLSLGTVKSADVTQKRKLQREGLVK